MRKIAIIGAGAGGLAAGHRLRQMGHEHVHLYEKAGRVGGKCSTIEIEGRTYEMGAVVVGVNTYPIVKQLISEFGCHLLPANRVGLFEVEAGGALTGWPLALAFLKRGRPAVKKFLKALQAIPHHETPGYTAFSPEEFGKTFMQWAAENEQLGIEEVIAPGFVGWGYQYLDQVASAYVFKLYDYKRTHYGFTYRPFRGALMQTIAEGYGELWRRVAEHQTVHLNSPVLKLCRKNGVVLTTPHGSFEYDDVIITCPLESIAPALGLSAEERVLFEQVEMLNLHTFTARVSKMGRYDLAFFRDNVTQDRAGRPVGAFRRWRDSDIWVYYSLANHGQTKEQLQEFLLNDLAACGAHVHEVIRHEQWRYFPHVSPENFKKGFYPRLEALQGVHNTYFGGEIMGFSSVEGTANYSYSLVERFFGEGV